jgi:hypothetical protein
MCSYDLKDTVKEFKTILVILRLNVLGQIPLELKILDMIYQMAKQEKKS